MRKLISIASISFILLSARAQVVIENFESADSENLIGGYWYSFNDNVNGGKSSVRQGTWDKGLVPIGSNDSSAMLSLDVFLNKGTYQWSPYYCVATQVKKTNSINPKNYDGISYWHKGVAHSFRVDIPDVKDYDYHQLQVPASDEWTLVTVEFSELQQEGWGKPVKMNLDNSVNLAWNVNVKSGRFEIDNIQFEKEIIYEKQYNMKVLQAETPEPLPLLGNVKTPLNELAKKHLTKGMNFTNWGESGKITSTDPNSWRFNEKMVKKQADQGFLGIRLPIDFDLYIVDRELVLNGSKKKIEIEPILYTILDSMNIWTKRHGLSFTIDYHAYDGTYNRAASKNEGFKKTMASLWRVIAEHFVDEKREDLFLELTNEPGLSLPSGEMIDQSDWTSLAQLMIDSIRTVDKTRPLIFGDTKWYSLDELVKNTPFKDKYIIYCFHMYDPFVFSHQGASWTGMGTMKEIPFPYSPEKWSTEYRDFGIKNTTPEWVKLQLQNYYKEGNKQHIMNRLAKVKNWAFEHNVPLICNEWGAYPKSAKIEDLNAYFKTMGEVFQEMDIAWQVWFGVTDNEFNLLPGMADALDLEVKK